MRLRAVALASVVVLALFAAACSVKYGREFPSPKLDSIINGRTAKADLVRMFGEPTQVGIKDGDQTWTWYHGQKGSKEEFFKQLDVTFNNQGVVKSHGFSSSFPEDMKVR